MLARVRGPVGPLLRSAWWPVFVVFALALLGCVLSTGQAHAASGSPSPTPSVMVTPSPVPSSTPASSTTAPPAGAACSTTDPCTFTLDPEQFVVLGGGLALLVFLGAAGVVSAWGRRG